MITRRDIAVAFASVLVTAGAAMAWQQKANIIGPSVYDWNKMPVHKSAVGEVRPFFSGPTATLKNLEVHVTTLNPGQLSHPPHKHPNEELVIIREGTVETLSDGQWKRLGPGSVILNASNSLHGLRNVGTTPATYHVVNWTSSDTPPKQ